MWLVVSDHSQEKTPAPRPPSVGQSISGKQFFEKLDGREIETSSQEHFEDMRADLLELVCEMTGGQHPGSCPEG